MQDTPSDCIKAYLEIRYYEALRAIDAILAMPDDERKKAMEEGATKYWRSVAGTLRWLIQTLPNSEKLDRIISEHLRGIGDAR